MDRKPTSGGGGGHTTSTSSRGKGASGHGGRSAPNKSSELGVEELVALKRLKESGNTEAQAIWDTFQSTKDSNTFASSTRQLLQKIKTAPPVSKQVATPEAPAIKTSTLLPAVVPVAEPTAAQLATLSIQAPTTATTQQEPTDWSSSKQVLPVPSNEDHGGTLLTDILSSLRIDGLLGKIDNTISASSLLASPVDSILNVDLTRASSTLLFNDGVPLPVASKTPSAPVHKSTTTSSNVTNLEATISSPEALSIATVAEGDGSQTVTDGPTGMYLHHPMTPPPHLHSYFGPHGYDPAARPPPMPLYHQHQQHQQYQHHNQHHSPVNGPEVRENVGPSQHFPAPSDHLHAPFHLPHHPAGGPSPGPHYLGPQHQHQHQHHPPPAFYGDPREAPPPMYPHHPYPPPYPHSMHMPMHLPPRPLPLPPHLQHQQQQSSDRGAPAGVGGDYQHSHPHPSHSQALGNFSSFPPQPMYGHGMMHLPPPLPPPPQHYPLQSAVPYPEVLQHHQQQHQQYQQYQQHHHLEQQHQSTPEADVAVLASKTETEGIEAYAIQSNEQKLSHSLSQSQLSAADAAASSTCSPDVANDESGATEETMLTTKKSSRPGKQSKSRENNNNSNNGKKKADTTAGEVQDIAEAYLDGSKNNTDHRVDAVSSSRLAEPLQREELIGVGKTQALLSFLKSTPAAPVVNPFAKSPPQLSAYIGNTSSTGNGGNGNGNVRQVALPTASVGPLSTLAPLGTLDVAKSPNVAPIPGSSTPLTANDVTAVTPTAVATATTPGGNNNSQKTAMRVTRNNGSSLIISIQNNRRQEIFPAGSIVLRPGNYLTVHWTIPESALTPSIEGASKPECVLGLTRCGAFFNQPCIIAKSIGKPQSQSRTIASATDMSPVLLLKGKVQFHAPKTAGRYVFRLFDQSNKHSINVTWAASTSFVVNLEDLDALNNIKFILEMFGDRASRGKAINQFATAMEHTVQGQQQGGQQAGRGPLLLHQTVDRCIGHIVECVADAGRFIDELKAKEAAIAASEDDDEVEPEGKRKSEVTAEEVKEALNAHKLHGDAHEAIRLLRQNSFLWPFVEGPTKARLEVMDATFCPILQRYFGSIQAMQTARVSEFGFTPTSLLPQTASSPPPAVSREAFEQLDRALAAFCPELFPRPDFASRREDLRLRVQHALVAYGAVPPQSNVVLYGSSVSQFGSDGADADMCVAVPSSSATVTGIVNDNGSLTLEEKRVAIVQIGAALEQAGFTDIQVIATARIPIVNFKDPESGLDGDITFHNPLAVSNTALLRAYSEIDPRVRAVAYVIKHWAKKRHVNSPGDGTLSSYGYLLLLIHFLQNRAQPIVPNLQAIPEGWSGENLSDSPSKPPEWMKTNPADGSECNTYFYKPDAFGAGILKAIAGKNRESLLTLLIEFFHYYALRFDYRRNAVSIRTGSVVSKLDKAESASWSTHDRLSIEDPFEVSYDVAHVVKPNQMKYIRKEFLRAFTVIYRTITSTAGVDTAMAELFEEAEIPKFVRDAQRKRANSATALLAAVSELDVTLDD